MVVGFFPKKDIIMHLLFKIAKNTLFFNEISSKNLKILNGSRFNLCISISYTIKKLTQDSIHNLSFEIYMQFFQTLWHVLFFQKYTPYIQVFHYLLNFFK
jgi:hypothetical protein